MRWSPFPLPDGLPVSLWFFAITAIVYLLQRFPPTGIFLMVVAAAFWSVLLINIGMAGLIVEAVTRRVSLLWLLVPCLYFGGYYWCYFHDQRMLKSVSSEVVRGNAGKSLAFDPGSNDLLIERSRDGMGPRAAAFTEVYGLARAYDGDGRVYLVGTRESCKLLRGNQVFRSAGIQSYWIPSRGTDRRPGKETGFCTIIMPGRPDKPVVRVTEQVTTSRRGRLPVTVRDLTARDEASGATATVRTGVGRPLKPFPMPVIGCALNSGAPSWNCFASFMRDNVQLVPGSRRGSGGVAVLAELLGLKAAADLARSALGPDRFKPMADRADAELAAEELALLEAMLADPGASMKGAWFKHLPSRPELVAPFADRIFAALGALQASDLRYSDNGRELWRLVAILPEAALSPHRARMAEWMKPEAIRDWTRNSLQAFARLDVADAVQRDIVLTRLEQPRGELPANLLAPFCRMGSAAPQDAKQRLLAVWRARGAGSRERGRDQVRLYLTLARLGLKAEAGRVEQRYMSGVYQGIWDEVTPDTPAEICELSENDLHLRYRRV